MYACMEYGFIEVQKSKSNWKMKIQELVLWKQTKEKHLEIEERKKMKGKFRNSGPFPSLPFPSSIRNSNFNNHYISFHTFFAPSPLLINSKISYQIFWAISSTNHKRGAWRSNNTFPFLFFQITTKTFMHLHQ